MKILFLARYLPQEGSTTHIYTIAKELIDRENEVYIISAGPKKEEGAIKIFEEITNYGVKHYKVNFPLNPHFSILGKIHQLYKYIIATPKVMYIMFKLKPDIIHVHYPVTSYLAKIYTKITGKKFITTHHISGIPKHILHKKADYVIAISRDLQEELLRKFKYNNEQVKLIFNGVSKEKFNKKISQEVKQNIKIKLNLPIDRPIIGFVGSLNKRKGIDILLEACSKITDINFHIVLVGDGDKNWLLNLINKFRLDNKISVYPFQDPVKFYSIFDVFVLPSRKEGFGLVSIEAMMMGIPTIRSNVEGANDQIKHNINGFIFKNEDVQELSKYIRLLLQNNELRKNMGQKARLYATNKFSADIMINKLIQLYKEILE